MSLVSRDTVLLSLSFCGIANRLNDGRRAKGTKWWSAIEYSGVTCGNLQEWRISYRSLQRSLYFQVGIFY